MFSKQFSRTLHTTLCYCKNVKLKNFKGKGASSAQWLTRQLSDPYVDKAKMMNYRCRSAFKLVEMDDRFKFLSPGQIVIDCGAAPGSWTQVAVKRVNADNSKENAPFGTVISIDKQQIYPIMGATILGNSDFTTASTQDKIKTLLENKKVDTVLSDMAPNATGVKDMDDENIINLCYSVLRFAVLVSNIDATLVVKLWQSNYTKTLENDMLHFYKTVKTVKPQASRSDSAEIFLLAREFKGLKCS
ncbi:hypothetical protein ILUMI_04320 [Ignelater luminosus]|uniref:rRNA methyltransferase 2, mitochondrial n=1 Tax=Ignelater luminosus TaxID=2038154 RepID=A0A8K0DCU0_IGNLU|nr:hypothetical protein ILUMI_04320 [Ignelater luminosus]